jgi:TRAP-type C4-dicarboxylate transport system permease small subunit
MRDTVLALDRRITGLAWTLACVLLAVVSALGLWQVLARFILSQPSVWTEEVLRRLLIWMVMLGTVVAFRRGALVSVDLMLRKTTGTWHQAVRWTITLTALAYLAVLAWFGFGLVDRVRFQTFASLELSMGWAYAALPVGALLAMLAVVANHLDPLNEELDNAQ